MFFTFLSSWPEYAKKIRVMFALAPVAHVGHIRSPIRFLAPESKNFAYLIELLGFYEFLPHSDLITKWAEELCTPNYYQELICLNSLFILTGFDFLQFNLTWLPTILSHNPEGTSVRTIAHYAQGVNSGNFSHFDFGWFENYLRYNQITPPVYSLAHINTPIVLFWGKNDYLADPQDVSWLASQLPNVAGNYKVPLPDFNHVDFVWGIDAWRYVYQPLLKYLPFF